MERKINYELNDKFSHVLLFSNAKKFKMNFYDYNIVINDYKIEC